MNLAAEGMLGWSCRESAIGPPRIHDSRHVPILSAAAIQRVAPTEHSFSQFNRLHRTTANLNILQRPQSCAMDPKPIDFVNVFGTSIALHLAYTMLADVRFIPIKRFHDSVQYFKDYRHHLEPENEKYLLCFIVGFEHAWILVCNDLKRLIGLFSAISVVVAIFSLGCLIFAGFNPSVEWSVLTTSVVLALSLLPMPLFLIITHFAAKKYVPELEKLATNVRDEFQRLSDRQLAKQSG